MKNKEVLDLTTVVRDSYKHMEDLGKENPDLDDIINDIIDNYKGYEEECSSCEKWIEFMSAVRQELNRLGLFYRFFEWDELDEC